jgi:S1-C subfamily serine protease
MANRWYVSRKAPDGTLGQPELLAWEELGRRFLNAELEEETLACEEGATTWRPLGEVMATARPSTSVRAPAMPAATPSPLPMPAALPRMAEQPTPNPTPAPQSVMPMLPPPRTTSASTPPGYSVSMPPAGGLPGSAAPDANRKKMLVWASSGGGAALVLLLVLVGVLVKRGSGHAPDQAIVHVKLATGAGTGFFVKGPDEWAYVATAYHVVDSGEPVLIERTIGSGTQKHVEAFPDAEVVAFDADADLAIVRLNHVKASEFATIALAKEPVADEPVNSYGFPASSLAKQSGMVSKPGKILSIVKFPVVDTRTGEIIRNDAIDGLLVSTEIEPGFSGGPTCNDRGEVVGVNVTKDTVHRAQNGAVSVSALKTLLSQVKALKDQKDPTPDEVKALLTQIEREYLLLPIDRRSTARESEFVSASDTPRIEELIATLRKLQNDTTRDPETKLSGQAALGLALARLPGKPLETYMDRSTRKALAACETRERGLQEFFAGLSPKAAADSPIVAERCSAVAFRPVTWDLTAMTMQWEGKDHDISVSKVESVDPVRHVYRASARFSGVDYLVDVWVATDGGRLRLKIFDDEGRATGLSAARTVDGSKFQGTWRRVEPRTARNFGRDVNADVETDETMVVSVGTNGAANITHQIHRKIYVSSGWGKSSCDVGLDQAFAGTLQNGAIVSMPQRDAKPTGDVGRCWLAFPYAADQAAVLKVNGDKLTVYRTDGVAFPEAAEFRRLSDDEAAKLASGK